MEMKDKKIINTSLTCYTHHKMPQHGETDNDKKKYNRKLDDTRMERHINDYSLNENYEERNIKVSRQNKR